MIFTDEDLRIILIALEVCRLSIAASDVPDPEKLLKLLLIERKIERTLERGLKSC